MRFVNQQKALLSFNVQNIAFEVTIYLTTHQYQKKFLLAGHHNYYYLNKQKLMQKQSEQLSLASKYTMSQLFGQPPCDNYADQDTISIMKFDRTGDHLALADRAGRLIIFKQDIYSSGCSLDQRQSLSIPYNYMMEFQSHFREFDVLKSQPIAQSINCLSWMRPQQRYLKLITTNSKQIKLWKVFEKKQRRITRSSVSFSNKDITMPKINTYQSAYHGKLQSTFQLVHQGNINTIQASNNQEYLVSSDQRQIFLWNLHKPQKPFMLIDKSNQIYCSNFNITDFCEDRLTRVKQHKPKISIQNIDPTFVSPDHINCFKMHPVCDSLLAYGTSKGKIKLFDFRISSKTQANTLEFSTPSTTSRNNFFSEMVSSVSKIQFTENFKYLISRDYMTVKIWDVANSHEPITVINVQENLQEKLCQLFQLDFINDKFPLSISKNGDTIMTGNYNNSFHMMNFEGSSSSNYQYQLNHKKNTKMKDMNAKINSNTMIEQENKHDFNKKVMAVDIHPNKLVAAAACLNSFFIYSLS